MTHSGTPLSEVATRCLTIATASHLPKVSAMTQSLRRANPDLPCTLVLAEREPLDPATRSLLVDVDEVLLAREVFGDGLAEWAAMHSALETSCMLKPSAARHLLRRADVGAVVYLDADTEHHAPLTPVLDAVASASLVVTPHLSDAPDASAAASQAELDCLVYGAFNLGVFAVADAPEAHRLLDWWDARVRERCSATGTPYLDQGWMDLATGLFDDVRILRHRGCNVATWNAAERIVARGADGAWRVDAEPLVFCHYAAWDSGAFHSALPALRTRNPGFVELATAYGRELAAQAERFDPADGWSFADA